MVLKKIIITIILGMFLISLATAGIILSINKDITLTEEQKDALSSIELNNYNVIDYQLGAEEIERCLNKEKCWEELYEIYDEKTDQMINISIEVCESALNTCKRFKTYYEDCLEYNEIECISPNKIYYTEQETINILDNWEKERLKLIASATISRENIQREIIREGVTEIK